MTVERVAAVVLLALAVLLLAAAVVDRDPWLGLSAAVLVAWPLVELRSGSRQRARSTRSSEAAERWHPARVLATTAGEQGEVAAVRALRRADPDLSLADAVELVRESRRR